MIRFRIVEQVNNWHMRKRCRKGKLCKNWTNCQCIVTTKVFLNYIYVRMKTIHKICGTSAIWLFFVYVILNRRMHKSKSLRIFRSVRAQICICWMQKNNNKHRRKSKTKKRPKCGCVDHIVESKSNAVSAKIWFCSPVLG